MVTIADVKYIVTADTKGAVTQIRKVDESIGGMKQQAQKSVSPLKGMFGQLAAGLGATIGIGIAFRKLTQFIKGSVGASREQELAEKGMTDALISTGREVPVNTQHFKNYAKEIQSATRYGDEQVLSAQALLIQLTNLDRDGLDAATKGSVGLATVFKTDLKAATNLVAKALAGNYGALSRYGISVKDLNTDEEKRASLLDQLGTLYKRSTGETDSYEGAMDQLRNTFGDTTEKIGDTIVKSEEFRGTVQLIQETLSNFVASGAMDNWATKLDLIIKNIPIFNQLKRSLMLINADLAIQAAELKRAEEAGEDWYEFLKNSNTELKIFGVDVYGAMRGLIDLKSEGDGANKTLEITATVIETEVHPALKEMINILGVLKGAQPVLKDTFEEAIPPARDFAGIVLDNVQPSLEGASTETEDFGKTTQDVVSDSKSLWDEMADGLKTKWASTYSDMIQTGKIFKGDFSGLWDDLKQQFFDILGQMLAKWTTDFLGGLLGSAQQAGGGILSAITGGGGGAGGLGGLAVGAAGATPWGAIAMGAGALLGTLLGGGGGPSSTDSWHFEHIWMNSTALYPILTENQGIHNETILIRNNTLNTCNKLNKIINFARQIEKNTSGTVSAQGGFYGTLRRDVTIRAHKGEDVSITPRGRRNSLYKDTQQGRQKVHIRGVINPLKR